MSSIFVGDALEHAVALYGDKEAIVDGDVRLTYRQAGERVRRLAAGLAALGLEPGMHLAILADNSHQYWETFFAAHFAGTPLAPLNTRLARAELEFILRDGEIRALIVSAAHLELMRGIESSVDGLDHVIVLGEEPAEGRVGYEELLASEPLTACVRDWREDDMVHLCYTGGTTGLPKGVMLSQRNVLANSQHIVMTYSVSEDDTWLHIAPMFHIADAWACFAFTMMGARHVFVPTFTPQGFLDAVEAERVTFSLLVPTMVNFVVNHPSAEECDFSSLRLLLCGGAPMAVDRILAARELMGPIFCQAYGMTETAPLAASQRLEWLDYETAKGRERLASCGRQVAGVRIRVVDGDGNDVPAGGTGEVLVRGANVMLSYWRRPEETALALADGWMHTGDVARIDDEGFLYIVDRARDMIISGGENVFSTEVENALYEHPAVLEAAVIGIPDERWGEAVHAVVALRPDAEANEAQIIAHCHELIAGYKCPKSVAISTDPLPKSGPGKILKTELRKPYWEGHERAVN